MTLPINAARSLDTRLFIVPADSGTARIGSVEMLFGPMAPVKTLIQSGASHPEQLCRGSLVPSGPLQGFLNQRVCRGLQRRKASEPRENATVRT